MNSSGFNPKARWDRHIPGSAEESPDFLQEGIAVLAWFKNAKIIPRRFLWKNKLYKIKKITYHWQERRGQEMVNYFTVHTGGDLYQISFNNTSYRWSMDKVIT